MDPSYNQTETVEFVERPFEEVEGGFYDDNMFYLTPNGSFWDNNGRYFNREKRDKRGGTYNEDLEYVPGPGWDEDFQCYQDEVEEVYGAKDLTDNNVNEILKERLIEDFHQYKPFYKFYNCDYDVTDLEVDDDEYNEEEGDEVDYIHRSANKSTGMSSKAINSHQNEVFEESKAHSVSKFSIGGVDNDGKVTPNNSNHFSTENTYYNP